MESTIAAIATAPGEGGIGIIRLSGEDSLRILKEIFRYKSGSPAASFKNRYMTYGDIIGDDGVIDEAMVVFMAGPHSYTGEDVVEIQCHGSIVSLGRILRLVIDKGASLAERGEFTKRAFLNGRINLSQAEAVIDLIKAKSETGLSTAVSQLNGSLSSVISDIRKQMADLISDIIAHIEYPEEDLEEMLYGDIIAELDRITERIQKLADSTDTGRTMRDGLKISIIGKPNAGKSSLLNAILKNERAIVTDIPGTTRDTIEEYASIAGIPVILTDTAGIRETDDIIEKMGIEKSRKSTETADLVFLMIDGSRRLDDEDLDILDYTYGMKRFIIINKSDLKQETDEEALKAISKTGNSDIFVSISAATGDGIDKLKENLKRIVYKGELAPSDDIMVTNVRHEELLRHALSGISDARSMLENGEALDFAESDLRDAWIALGEITGESVSDDIITEVFSRFCLGK